MVPAPAEDVFAFLSDLRNHWELTARSIRVVQLDGDRDGGVVRIRGPLGARRTVHTRVTATRSPRLIIGVAELPGGTRALVSWTLAGRIRTTRVRLTAEIEHATPLDRLLLAAGGRTYMQGVFARTLERLAEHFTPAAPEPTPAP
ncbi:MAG: hypothetical protein QOG63_765 [Thermoleophilaceae bacterium]|nr:hypothetical protein [Thermoleophilaceae bacterium]